MKALTQLISPGVASKPLQIVTSSHEQDNQSDIPIIGAHSSTLIRPQCTFTPPESKRLSTVTLPDLSSSNPTLRKTKSANKLRLSLQDDSGYEPIDSVTEDITLNSNPSYSPFSTFHGKSHHGSSSIINPKSVSTESSQEEGCIPAQSAADHLHQHTQSKSDPPPESTMAVSRTLSNLSRFSPDQMEHLIDMLRMITPQPQNGNSPIPEHEAAPGSRLPSRPLKPTKHSLILPKVSGSASLAKFRERPSQLTDLFKCKLGVDLLSSHRNLYTLIILITSC